MNREQFGPKEATYLLVSILSAKAFLTMPRYMMLDGATAAWLEVILSGVYGALGWTLVMLLMRRFPGRSLIQAIEEVLGPYLGLPVQLLYVGIFLYITVVVVRQFAETVLSVILPMTPISVIIVSLVAVSAYTAYLGIEAVVRVSRFFLPIVLVAVGLLLILVLPSGARMTRLLPLLGSGIGPLLWRPIFRSSLYIELLLLPMLAPSLKESQKMARVGYQAIAVTTVFWLAVVLVFQMIFPYPAGGYNPFPLLSLARMISIGRFVQRIESVFIFAWIFAAAAKLAASLLGTIVGFAQTFRLRMYRPLAFPFAVLTVALTFIPSNLVSAMHDDREVLRIYGFIPAFLLTFAIWGLAVLRRKGGVRTDDQSSK